MRWAEDRSLISDRFISTRFRPTAFRFLQHFSAAPVGGREKSGRASVSDLVYSIRGKVVLV